MYRTGTDIQNRNGYTEPSTEWNKDPKNRIYMDQTPKKRTLK